MQRSKFIFVIDAERHYNILIRIMATFNRQGVPILELSSSLRPDDDQLRVTLSVEDTKDNAVKLSKKIDREIDVIDVNLFEQLDHKDH
jgi:hypothetical protein